jgi:DedD protein
MAQDSLQSKDEQELQFKKRARRRLVGSIALVVLMLIILPMVLEDRTSQGSKDPLNVSMAVDPSENMASQHEPLATDNGLSTEAQIPPAISEPVQGLVSQEIPEQVSPVNPVPDVKNNANQSAPEVKPVSEVKTPEAPNKAVNDKSLGEKSTAHYFIKVGVFSDANNVKKIQAKLSGASLKSYTESIDGKNGKSTRLIVGDYPTKSEAEKKLSKVKSLGYGEAVIGHHE